ncbi:hypothetical protein AZE42_13599 [Rhizopogon vesiculosus]|uniref:Uncharacterized protein n=1 Tax=Rhizopogon vesiculosus TaxID=180088 RepID=A0A1J8QZU9_9AGAM|nr:hypothetical protein AZE42_13599 [Rhizopogon vesiculosus]
MDADNQYQWMFILHQLH